MRKLVCSFKHDGEHARGPLDTLAIALVFIVFLSKKKKGPLLKILHSLMTFKHSSGIFFC